MFRKDVIFVALETLNCIETEERRFDELMLELRLRRRDKSLGRISVDIGGAVTGSKTGINMIVPVRKGEIFAARLWEVDDDPPADMDDDHLGTLVIEPAKMSLFPDANTNQRVQAFHHHARYEMTYRLLSASVITQILDGVPQTLTVSDNSGSAFLINSTLRDFTVIDLSGTLSIGAK